MTDTHPVRNENEAKDYIERVKMFDDSLKANLVWLEEQKKLGIFAPKFVFDHVIRQLEEMIEYEDSENPLVQVFSKKISDIGISEEKRNEFFGFYAFSGKMTAFVGPFLFGLVTRYFDTQQAGLIIIFILFFLGYKLMKRL